MREGAFKKYFKRTMTYLFLIVVSFLVLHLCIQYHC